MRSFSAISIWFSKSARSVVSARSNFHDKFSFSASSCAFAMKNENRLNFIQTDIKHWVKLSTMLMEMMENTYLLVLE